MATEFDKDRILNRVKKMMTLANDAAATEGERDNAIRMAHATLAKYNLTMGEADNAGSAEKRVSDGIDVGGLPWMVTVANAVATLFFCKVFITRTRGSPKVQTYFVGKESNVATAQGMTQYVIASISKEGKRAAKDVGETGNGTYWRSFCKGAAHKVYFRCIEIRRAAEAAPAEVSNGRSLVLASVYTSELQANNAFLAESGTRLSKGRSHERNTASSAYAAGGEYGERIGLQNQIGGAGNGRKMIR